MHIRLESPIENVASVLFSADSPECDPLQELTSGSTPGIAYLERQRKAVGSVIDKQPNMEC